jgi:membrane protease subunit (stomatin/prohibitin family)
MGLIRATVGSIGGTLADQWKDFHTVPQWIGQTAAFFPAERQGTNSGRGSNVRASDSVITNGTKIVVPEGYGLLTFEDGGLTSFIAEPGAYIWNSDDPASESILAGDGFVSPLVKQSWQRFKFGGRPGSQQAALFVNLKELPNNKFGTQSAIYWDDGYLNAQVGATTRGTYTLKIVDPILFVKNLLPADFLQNGNTFDFTDPGNDVATQLFTELIASLAGAFSAYTNNPSNGNRISNIQRDSIGFAASLASVVESSFNWSSERGVTIEKVAIVGIEYDEPTRELLKTVQRADALSGNRGNSNLQASVAAGLEAAGSVDGSAGIVGLGIAAGGVGIGGLQQPPSSIGVAAGSSPGSSESGITSGSEDELLVRLEQLKRAFDAGLITQEDFDSARAKALGL